MRDLRKFRNKLTLELDNRQIAFLFTGLLAVLAIVFALGVVVGKGLTGIESSASSSPGNYDMPTPKQILAEPIEVTEQDIPKGPVEMAPGPGMQTVDVLNATPTPSIISSLPLPTETPKPVATPPPSPVSSTPPPAEVDSGPPKGPGWTVQISAYPNEEEALSKQKMYKTKGVQAYIVKAAIPGKGVWYRLRVGQFSTKQGAQQYADALAAKEGIKPFVTPL